MLLLGIAGNVSVAAYGVVANLSLVAMSIFNGLAQGAQPLISKSYGEGQRDHVKSLLRWSLIASAVLEAVTIMPTWDCGFISWDSCSQGSTLCWWHIFRQWTVLFRQLPDLLCVE